MGYSCCIFTNLLFVLGQTVLVECFGFPPQKMCVPGGLWGSSAVPTPLTRQVHDCMIRAAQGFLPSLTGESIPVEIVISKSLGCDESQMMFLKNSRLFSPRCFVHAISLLPCKSISYYFSFLFSSFGWANGRELWSQLNGLEEV